MDVVAQEAVETATKLKLDSCEQSKPFFVSQLKVGHPDKLNHKVLDILWCAPDYAVYRSERGIYVHFADCPDRERDQRKAFTQIAPELCELRVFTGRMRRSYRSYVYRPSWFGLQVDEADLFDHNIAQALMLALEGQIEDAKRIVRAALSMAVRRVTNDNTIRYICACMFVAALWIISCSIIVQLLSHSNICGKYFIASIFGAIGAVFSIISRIEAFEMKPCQQSNMNYWMSGIRVMIGIIGGVMLVLFLTKTLSWNDQGGKPEDREMVAALGFIGGFSERLLKNLIKRTADLISPTAGTAVQEARRLEDARGWRIEAS